MSYSSEIQSLVNLLACPTSTTNPEWKGLLERVISSTISRNLVLSSSGYGENCGGWRWRAKEFGIHAGILESKMNCHEWKRGLEVNIKYLLEALEHGQVSGSQRQGGMCWVILLNQGTKFFLLKNISKKYFCLYFFSIRKSYLCSGQRIHMLGKNPMLTSLGYSLLSLQPFRVRLIDV